MKVYVVFCPDGFERFEIDEIFHGKKEAYEYIEDKENWIVEEWRVK